jgi:hypothetical protein
MVDPANWTADTNKTDAVIHTYFFGKWLPDWPHWLQILMDVLLLIAIIIGVLVCAYFLFLILKYLYILVKRKKAKTE